jgi:hypothetical protein
VAALEEGSRDNLEYVKERALAAAAELLRAKPEAEAALMSLLVNKLGDPSRKLASKVATVAVQLRIAFTHASSADCSPFPVAVGCSVRGLTMPLQQVTTFTLVDLY